MDDAPADILQETPELHGTPKPVSWGAGAAPRPQELQIAPDIAAEAARIRAGLHRTIATPPVGLGSIALPANPDHNRYSSYADGSVAAEPEAPPAEAVPEEAAAPAEEAVPEAETPTITAPEVEPAEPAAAEAEIPAAETVPAEALAEVAEAPTPEVAATEVHADEPAALEAVETPQPAVVAPAPPPPPPLPVAAWSPRPTPIPAEESAHHGPGIGGALLIAVAAAVGAWLIAQGGDWDQVSGSVRHMAQAVGLMK